MDSQDKKSVPKFSSFKAPSARSEPRHKEDRKSRRPGPRYSEERSRSPRRSNRQERRRSPGRRPRSRSPRRATSRSRRKSPERREKDNAVAKDVKDGSVSPNGEGSVADLFIIDLKGDRHNLTFGATHRYAVPKYRRSGRGQVLGADTRYRIDRDHLDSDTLVLRIKDSLPSNTSKSARPMSKRIRQPEKLLRVKTEAEIQSPADLDQDFISFDSAVLDGSDGASSDGDLSNERNAYRSIHGKAKEEDFIPQHMELVDDEIVEDESNSAERKARHAELLRSVKDNPTDVAGWLRLIDHQDLLILGPEEDSRPLTYNEQQSVAAVKLSIYEKAIKQSATSPNKDSLLLGRLQEGAHLWDAKKLLSQWNKTLQENSECVSLWVSYLNFRQTDFQNFDFEQLMATFSECLELNASAANPAKNQVQCYLFLRMTLFLREAGYLELAVGIWQAVLEFTCFKPQPQSQQVADVGTLASFRSYWEDEVPRIGENGSLTWRGWVDNPSNPAHNYALHENKHRVEVSSLMDSWERAEKECTLSSRLPSRTLDQLKSSHGVDEQEHYVDDAYTVVLFSDLDRVLKLFHDFGFPDELFESFLYFCHLPHLTRPGNIQTTHLWSADNFLKNDSIDHMEPGLSCWLADEKDAGTSTSPLRFPVSNFLHTTCTLFPEPNTWFDSFGSLHQDYQSSKSSIIDQEWVQMTLRSLVERGPTREAFDDELAEYTLGLMFARDRKKAKKYAKTLLKKWTSSLRICNALALMEWRNGSPDAAVQVWSSSISWSQKFSDDLKIDSGILWNSWAWELLQQGDNSRASYVLHAIPVQSIDKDAYNNIQSTGVACNPTSTLQVKSYLRDCQALALGYRRLPAFVAYTDCLALLLFTEKYHIQAALEIYSYALEKSNSLPVEDQKSKPYIIELLHQARARLLFFHCSTRSSRLKALEIRAMLQDSVSLFPHNTIFLSLFTWNESRFNILDRIRNVNLLTKNSESRYTLDNYYALSAAAAQTVPITTHLLSIWSELCRPTWAGSTHHSTRAAFEKALGENMNRDSMKPYDKQMRNNIGTGSARTNLMTWKLYIIFEVYHAQDIDAAKAVFYRAIRACPWSKQLFMLAFQYLQHDKIRHIIPINSNATGFLFDDLRQLYYAMTEKQLRIHVDIEDGIQALLAERQNSFEEDHQTRSDKK
ncbi:unnamed protein product [Penicillium pancosmium]